MASNTTNLDLLKKDPATDGNDTFNIQTMLNDNWDKIDEAVGQVREELQDIDVPAATVEKAGIVQLSNAINGTRENVAATEKAVGMAFQAGNERKAELVAALVAKGVAATISETWAQLLAKVTALVKATGNATAAQVLSGATASNASGPITGTMPDQSRIALGDGYVSPKSYRVDGGGTLVIEPQTGYYTEGLNTMGFGSIAMYDPDFVSANLPKDVDIFGVQGVLERLTTVDRNAIISAIVGKGVAASAVDSNVVLAQKIGQIKTGMKSYSGNFSHFGNLNPTTISNIGFVPKVIVVTISLYKSAYVGGDSNGFQFRIKCVASTTSSNYTFSGEVNSPIYGETPINGYLYTTFNADSVIVSFIGSNSGGSNQIEWGIGEYTIYGE
ncbi:hypothetical protein FHR92_004098 [Fontibacillus solani]|uniref:Tail fiber protein n=1 Tax=Fontibacillus solani TaxID=1572857 RepID=A0A7W3SWV4_9BACL|nr:phage tail protein [Fontibacillus solani]MBA9087613.1 hypothetical protein [Fontibacillus solani]